jgi:Raf kinase inhibitor-like YbhB/YbcL family protein
MISTRLLPLGIASMALIFACGGDGDESSETLGATGSAESTPTASEGQELTSDSLAADGTIPLRFTCDGEDISPALSWGTPPEGTQSLALIMDDPDAPGGNFTHWLIYNLDPGARGLPEGVETTESPTNGAGGVQAENDSGDIGYGGPCPPEGSPHRYRFALTSLDTVIDLGPAASRDQILKAIDDHALEISSLTATYGR